MSQHDFNIANQTFPNFRADLNNALVAAATMSAGSSAPTTPYAYQLWFDTTTGTWKVRNSGNTAWISTITTDLATGNLDVTGTVTADGLTVDGDASLQTSDGAILNLKSTDNTLLADDVVGSITFETADSSSAGVAAKIEALGENPSGGVGLNFYSGFGGSPVKRMTLDRNGNVGIGTASPNNPLEISHTGSAAAGGLRIGDPSTIASDTGIYLRTSGDAVIGAAGGDIVFDTNMTVQEDMRITAAGKVGIGTSWPQSIVHIDQGASNDAQLTLETHSAGDSKMVFSQGQNAGNWAVGYDDGGGVTENSFCFAYKSDGYPSLSGQNKMLLTPAGNLGIATASPAYTLQVGEGNGQMSLGNATAGNGSSRLKFLSSNSQKNWQISTNDNVSGALEFTQTTAGGGTTFASSPAMLIHSSGALLVNTTSRTGTSNFVVSADTNVANPMSVVNTKTGVGTEYAILFYRAGSIVGSIQTSLTATSYISPSDYRLKTAVNYDWDATTRLKQLKPARFKWIADGDDAVPVDGFLAHEVSHDSDGNPLVPEAISGTKDGMMDEEYQVSAATGDIYTPAVEATYDDDGVELTAAVDEVIHSADVERPEELAEGQLWRETTAAVMGTRSVPDYQGIDQSKLTPLLTKALIEAVEKIEQLEARISALEAS